VYGEPEDSSEVFSALVSPQHKYDTFEKCVLLCVRAYFAKMKHLSLTMNKNGERFCWQFMKKLKRGLQLQTEYNKSITNVLYNVDLMFTSVCVSVINPHYVRVVCGHFPFTGRKISRLPKVVHYSFVNPFKYTMWCFAFIPGVHGLF